METNQNLQVRIDELFKKNSKIPFMQSKEILLLGYIYGETDAKNSIVKPQVIETPKKTTNNSNGSFTGTTKEFFNHVNQEIKKQEKDKKEEAIKKAKEKEDREREEKKIRINAKKEVLGKILFYLKKPDIDFLDVYNYIQTMYDGYERDFLLT